MARVSVIVPVYNAAKYLGRCVESILAQTFADFELLLIDDGSTDGSGLICDGYAAADTRVRVFHKDNGGVSSARNMGLREACGEWVTFVDADDYVAEEYMESFRPGDADELCIQSFMVNGVPVEGARVSDRVYEGKEIYGIVNENIACYLTAPWCKLFRRDIIESNGILFDEEISLGEDTIFSLSYISRIDSLRTVAAANYNYTKEDRGGLSSGNYTVEKFLHFLHVLYPIVVALGACHYVIVDRHFTKTSLDFYRRCRLTIASSDIPFMRKVKLYRSLYTDDLVDILSRQLSHDINNMAYRFLAKARLYVVIAAISELKYRVGII